MTMRIECDFRHGLVEPTITRGGEGLVLELAHRQDRVRIALSDHNLTALYLVLLASVEREES